MHAYRVMFLLIGLAIPADFVSSRIVLLQKIHAISLANAGVHR